MKKTSVVAGAVLVAIVVSWVVIRQLPALTLPAKNTDTQTPATTTEQVATTSESGVGVAGEDAVGVEQELLSLDVKPWTWVRADYADGRELVPNKAGDFVMTFGSGGGVSFETDCNSMSSSYEAYVGGLTFGPIMSTEMFCESSKETEFSELIANTKTYEFSEKGELLLKTEDGTIAVFR